MQPLTSAQRKHLRSQAHHLDAVILIGKQGVTDPLVRATDDALLAHELIKVRFNVHKEEKKALTEALCERTGSALAGMLGHVAILYRPHPEDDKRRIVLP